MSLDDLLPEAPSVKGGSAAHRRFTELLSAHNLSEHTYLVSPCFSSCASSKAWGSSTARRPYKHVAAGSVPPEGCKLAGSAGEPFCMVMRET